VAWRMQARKKPSLRVGAKELLGMAQC